ncbi:adenosylcobinamide-GDP ribazoletransferase [Proteiniclasticum sp. C24MP]|uniref:adenosylcobinamide-GDP ribazoletransferase n=1 Tax=Proteiniclasticum sp. C24MP TaxID=3374101 RepID=UPI0037549DD0
MSVFLQLISLFTKIPIPERIGFDAERLRKGVRLFPLAGLLVGLLQAAVAVLALRFFSREVAVAVSMAFVIHLTGGLHLDGLADTMDGILSARRREQMLLIMKDSRIGTHGVLALILFLLLKFLFLLEVEKSLLIQILVVLPVVGRTSMAMMLWGSRYAREDGLGNLFIGKTLRRESIYAGAGGAMLLYALNGLSGVLALILVFLMMLLFRRHLEKLLGGLTGDTLGAMNEMAELLFLPLILLLQGGGLL